jgi:DsbC/DsbD-like thiol-disulfide interchange protein
MAQGLSEYLQAFGAEEAPGEQVAAAASPKGEAASAEEKLTPAAEMSKEDAAKHDKLSATAYLSVDRLPAGGTCRIALVIDIDEGWHINANPAQPDYLVATELTMTSGKKTKLASVEYPKGETFKVEGIEESLSVYEGRCVIYGTLEVPKEAAGQSEQIELTVRYQTCNDKTCLRPAKLALRAEVPVAMVGGEVKKVNDSLFKPKPAKP